MINLFALCRINGQLQTKRVVLTQPVQAKVGAVFEEQGRKFLEGIDEEVSLGTDWKPDDDQLLAMDAPNEASAVLQSIENPLALPTLNARALTSERIVGLAVQTADGAGPRLLLQRFTMLQVLSRKALTLLLSGDTFNELVEPAFTLAGSLVGIVEDGKLKFKSFSTIKTVFSLKEYYQAATDQQIEDFCKIDSLSVVDIDGFKLASDQKIRGLVHALIKTEVLDRYSVDNIAEKANSLGIALHVNNDKIVMPTDRKAIKLLLRFLDDSIYEAPLSAIRYESNSKRKFKQ